MAVGGTGSIIIGGNKSKYKGGKNSVIVLTEWTLADEEYKPVCVKAIVIDGKKYKPDTWYTLKDLEVVECE